MFADSLEVSQVIREAPSPSPFPSLPLAVKKPGQSHHAYAELTLEYLASNSWRPIFHQGELFVLNESSGVWEPFERDQLLRVVAELHDRKKNCIRRFDYTGIADQVLSIAADAIFFEQAPVGIACSGTFYRVEGNQILTAPLGPQHKQRVMLDFELVEGSAPLFTQFLNETFHSDVEGEEEQQLRLVQEIAGAVLLGVMPRFQKAVLFYDPYGRAGKGTLERIVSELVPEQFRSALSPFKWDKEYYLAGLAGSRLNVVGELPDGDMLPSASFKSVLGGDLLAGRQPMKPVVYFRNEAAHIFTSNHLVTTRDHGEAFFWRWILVEFPNSLTRSGRPLDSGLADRIIAQELPSIAYWALQGGARLLEQGGFSTSVVHDRLMQKWRRSASSLDEFLHECCDFATALHERRSMVYAAYKKWCLEGGRKPLSKAKVKQSMEQRIGLQVHFATLDGYEIVRGLAVREDYKEVGTFF